MCSRLTIAQRATRAFSGQRRIPRLLRGDQFYGLERLEEIQRKGWVILVEGETDTATSTYNGFPALRVPGKTNWKAEWAELLKGLMVFVWQEPGAEGFAEDIANNLPDAMRVIAPSMAKDPCELAQLTGDRFPEVMSDLLDSASAVREAADRPVGAKIESYLSTQGQLFKRGWRDVWKTLELNKGVLLEQMPRRTAAEVQRWRDFNDREEKYNSKYAATWGSGIWSPAIVRTPAFAPFAPGPTQSNSGGRRPTR